MRLTSGQIRDLIARGETFRLECKKAVGGLPSTLWPSYSAFSNSDGGVILLGVAEKDGTFEVCGVPDADKLIRDFWNAVNNSECVSYSVSNLFGVWEKMGAMAPTFTETTEPDRVELIVPIERISSPVQKSGQKQDLSGQKSGQKQVGSGQKENSVARVLAACCEDVDFTQRGLAEKLGLAQSTIDAAIATLVKNGCIRHVGPKKGGHWEVLKED